MKVLALAADTGGSAFYRLEEPARVLKEQGVDVRVSTNISVEAEQDTKTQLVTVKEIQEDIDLLIVQRPLDNALTSLIKQAKRQGIATIVEIDDDFHTVHPNNVAAKGLNSFSYSGAGWVSEACREADHVTVSTPALFKYAPHGRVSLLRNNVPESIFEVKSLDVPRTGLALGWTGSTQTHPNDLQQTKNTLAGILKDDSLNFSVVGDGQMVRSYLGLPKDYPLHATGWVAREDYYTAMKTCIDIGIVPLELSAFNQAKCIDENTKVLTGRGVIRARDISTNDVVWNEDAWHQVQATLVEPERMGLKFTTDLGFSITLSPEHRMFVNDRWVEAKDITMGDKMHMQPETFADTPYVRVPWPSDSRMSRREGSSGQEFVDMSDIPTVEITPRWGRILGAFCGDGGISGKTAVTISCDGIDQDWIELLSQDFLQIGLNMGNVEKKMYDGTLIRKRDLRAASAHFVRVLKSWGLAEDRSSGLPKRVVRVPDFIWESPRDVVAEFIAGYFEADGCTTGAGADITSKNKEIIHDIQRLLLLFGITSKVSKRVHSNQTGCSAEFWHLTLRRAEFDIFYREIGFRSKRKIARSDVIMGRKSSNAKKPLSWEGSVVSIEDCPMIPVDIQVEGSVFSAAGFVSHNSDLKGIEMAALGIPFVASPTAEYLRLEAYGVGKTAKAPGDWRRHLNRLIDNPSSIESLATSYRDRIESSRTYEQNAHQWLEAWEQAIVYRKNNHEKEPTYISTR